jgi:CRISPR-associated endonuclease Csn1
MPEAQPKNLVLGIDLGANSLGWALVQTNDGRPASLVRAGVRIFDSAMDGNLVEGREESRNRTRREARLRRRQLWRRARRLRKVFNLLQAAGLLPAGPSATSAERQHLLNLLDESIRESAWFAAQKTSGKFPEPDHVLPYILRATALDEPLAPHFFGRAIYHLAQRRGFLSNRRQIRAQANDDEGQVKKSIGELREAIVSSGARTLGEHFARLTPTERRIRARWTARDMFVDEFNLICDSQAKHRPDLLPPDRRRALFRAVFHQRALKFDQSSIGRCELEPGQRRAPAHLLLAQRFRLLDKVNNLLIDETPLTATHREKLIRELQLSGDLTFKKVRKLLAIPREHAFNLERGGEERLPGNRTFAAFREALGQRWLEMSPEDQDRLVEYVYAFQNPAKLEDAARKKWALDDDAARKLAAISPEPDYFSLSVKAMRSLLPLLEQGVPLATARKQLYPEALKPADPLNFLPPVSSLTEIRNPAVTRSLTELRKVVNAIIRAHGKPAEIRIELARELKKPKWAREEASKRNRENQKARLDAAKRITAEIGIPRPSRTDIRKVLLADECGWHCPYTGRPISMRALFSEPQFDIEHIIPFSRSLDDSFTNLTLCAIDENRNTKGNKTPFEAYSGDPARYQEVLDRVRRFTGDRSTVAAKLRRFRMTPAEVEALLSDFSSRQLNDTSYSARLAQRYLGRLYGGVIDANGTRRVQASSGQVTAYLRNEWQLNGILSDGPTTNGGTVKKSRDDHRHHAIDAIAIALTEPASVKALSDAAQRAPAERRRRFAPVHAPWPDFVSSVRAEIEKIVVSHRVSKKVSGPLHEETIYAALPAPAPERRVRKPLAALTKPEVEAICDPGVKALVLAKLNGDDPKKVFANDQNLPFFTASDGRRIPIKRVRISKAVPTFALGHGGSTRHVASESNHHIEIFAELDENGNEVEWDAVVVSLAEAFRRRRNGLPIVQRDHGARRRSLFSLAAGEAIECDTEPGTRALFVTRKMSQQTSGGITIGFAPLADARLARDIQISRAWLWATPDRLRQRKARKVALGPLGDLSDGND